MLATSRLACPSRLELSAFDAAGRAGIPSGHVVGCARCSGILRELEEARVELLGGHAEAASRAAARRILEAVTVRQVARRRRFWQWLPVAFVPVAAALALFAVSPTALRPPTATDQVGSGAPAVRAKGGLSLEILCKRGERVFPVTEGADFFAGDRLRFAYTKPAAGYLMIFGVDDRGEVFPYYQDGILKGLEVGAGVKVMLPGSVELDQHRGWERVYALWSENAIDAAAVRDAVTRSLKAAGGDVREATRLPSAVELDQVSYLLRRP